MMVAIGAIQDQLPSPVDHVSSVVLGAGSVHLIVARVARNRNPVRSQLVVQNRRELTVDFLAVGANAHRAHFE